MSGDSITQVSAIAKDLYPNGLPKTMTYQDCPAVGLMPKKTNSGGEHIKVPVRFSTAGSGSKNFINAQTNKRGSKQVAFYVTRAEEYVLASMKNHTLLSLKGNEESFVDYVKYEIDGAHMTAGERLARELWGTGSMSIGQIDATTTIGTPVLKLVDPNQVINYAVGQVLQVSATDGGGTVRAGTLVVASTDLDLGTVTMTGNLTAGIAAIATGDYVFTQGDYDLGFKGILAWAPRVAPTSTPFYTVDRTVDSRLGGLRLDAKALGLSTEETLQRMMEKTYRAGGKTSHFLMTPQKMTDLALQLQTRVQYVNIKSPDMPEIGFEGIRVSWGQGSAICVADRYCPADVIVGTDINSWCLESIGDAVRMLPTNGLREELLAEAGDDAVEIRVGGYRTLWNNLPVSTCVAKVA